MGSIGTEWVAPGKGATVLELSDAMRANFGHSIAGLRSDAWTRLVGLRLDHRTNIVLTGAPLSDYDLKRIAVCE